ncbi:tetratricopeptide repeat protein [Desulfocicer vacuolatum]|uniref:tetratricopeptide repeat protein n=1 Tax=Desulfocicer vacuolatum TaxID=2298 RepID=UPI00111BE5D4|nr:tetratricopeptide repeat protein [Desulfocicer vacuolatum]
MIIISSCFAHGLTITADMQYDYALASQKEGAHETAMVEWKRFIHFFPLDSRIPTARFNLGISLFHLKKWDQARTIFQAQRFPYVGTYQNIESFFMLSKTLLAQGRIQGARRVLVDLLSASEVTEVKDRVLCALAWISLHRAGDMEPGALEQADAFLSQISGTGEAVFHTGEIRQAVKAIVNQEEKSPFVAGITALVPGGGFLYCQRYQDALAAFIINAGLIFAAHQSFDRGDNILGGLLSVVESGFYGGSIYGSISSAHKYNRFKTRKTLHRIQHLEPLDILYINQDGALKKPENRAMLFSIQIPF